MIMIRSNTKINGKPPPPVPPRPSKLLVAEALAKSRKTTPIRTAPPPPPTEVANSSSVNITLKPIQNLVSDNNRTVIFQSPKINTIIDNNNDNDDEKWDQLLNDRNHVNTLIDEMFASVLDVSNECNNDDIKIINDKTQIKINNNNDCDDKKQTTIVVVDNDNNNDKKKVQFDDRMNHELLISELESMRVEEDLNDKISNNDTDSIASSKIHHSDWVEVSNGQEVRLSSCQITIEDKEKSEKKLIDYDRIKTMSSLHGLPPLPKSLSGFNLLDGQQQIRNNTRGHLNNYSSTHSKLNGDASNSGRKSTNLDTQLAILRREMYSLRQLDLSLLSQLWSLNESIQDFRQILQDHEDRVLSPPSLSPTPSSGDDGDGDEFYMSANSMSYRTPPPPPPPVVRRPSSSSNASSLG